MITSRVTFARVAARLSLGIVFVWHATAIIAEDKVESSSVIPIAKSSEEQVGTLLTVETRCEGSSSRQMKAIAVEAFPLHLMSADSKKIASDILNDISLYRRLPELELEADRRCYEYFTNHPDVAVSIWRAMEISQVQMTRKSDTLFDTDTRDGTSGVVQVLLNTPEHYVVTCKGEFKSPAIKLPIQATAMMHLKPTFTDRTTVVHQLDMYVSFPSNAIETIARLISPVSNRIADRNFEEISLFVEMMSIAMTRQPGWVEQLTADLDSVSREDVDQLLQLTAALYVDAVKAERESQGLHTMVDDLLPPMTTAAAVDAEPIQ